MLIIHLVFADETGVFHGMILGCHVVHTLIEGAGTHSVCSVALVCMFVHFIHARCSRGISMNSFGLPLLMILSKVVMASK